MKILLSNLKKIIPIKASSSRIANDLTMLGHFCEGINKIEGEEVIGLEIRQNRGDCLSYLGIAKELSVLYGIPLTLREKQIKINSKNKLPLKVSAKKYVKRVMAVKISHVKVKPSPEWLRKFLILHDINPINNVVDATNYNMLTYGIPSHAFDSNISGEEIEWTLNKGKFQTLTSIDGTKIKLNKDTLLMVGNNQVQGLAGIVGGRDSGINNKTQEIIIEMAVYDRAKVNKDSRNLKVITEASTRLDKELDSELIPQAFANLIETIKELAGGEIDSQIFDHYPIKTKMPKIKLNLENISLIAGIKINDSFSLGILEKLGCKIKSENKSYTIIPPTMRKDLELEEDLVEDVIRFFGYDKIPANQPISDKKLNDVTPEILVAIENFKNKILNLGYDEVLSWPLVRENNIFGQDNNKRPINTENNINSNYPILRMSIIPSLMKQADQYSRYKVPFSKFFEAGKIYFQRNGKYLEQHSIAMFNKDRKALEKDIKSLGPSEAIWTEDSFGHYCEFNPEKQVSKNSKDKVTLNYQTNPDSIHELSKQIIKLDANLVFERKQVIETLLKNYFQKIGPGICWMLEVSDIYKTKNKFKYTITAYYYNISSSKAKKIHKKIFNL